LACCSSTAESYTKATQEHTALTSPADPAAVGGNGTTSLAQPRLSAATTHEASLFAQPT
jgi:hypothetical protein